MGCETNLSKNLKLIKCFKKICEKIFFCKLGIRCAHHGYNGQNFCVSLCISVFFETLPKGHDTFPNEGEGCDHTHPPAGDGAESITFGLSLICILCALLI